MYASATYVIDAGGILDFGSKIILPVGTSSRTFTGNLYGNGTVFKNAKIGYQTVSTNYRSALFGYANNAKLFDITIDSTCSSVFSGSFDYGTNGIIISSFISAGVSPYLVNCTSKMGFNVTNLSTTLSGSLAVANGRFGGLVGEASGGLTLVGCNYSGNVTVQAEILTGFDPIEDNVPTNPEKNHPLSVELAEALFPFTVTLPE